MGVNEPREDKLDRLTTEVLQASSGRVKWNGLIFNLSEDEGLCFFGYAAFFS